MKNYLYIFDSLLWVSFIYASHPQSILDETRQIIHEQGSRARHLFYQIKQDENVIEKRTGSYTDNLLPGERIICSTPGDKELFREFNTKVLQSYPRYYELQGEGPRARVGIFFYTQAEGKTFLLFAQEPIDATKPLLSGTYCDIGGHLSKDETFLHAALRIALNKTGGAYQINESDFLDRAYVYFRQSMIMRQIAIVFLEAPQQITDEGIMRALPIKAEPQYKIDYQWLDLAQIQMIANSLEDSKLDYNKEEFRVNNIHGDEIPVHFRPFVPEILKDSEVKSILELIKF